MSSTPTVTASKCYAPSAPEPPASVPIRECLTVWWKKAWQDGYVAAMERLYVIPGTAPAPEQPAESKGEKKPKHMGPTCNKCGGPKRYVAVGPDSHWTCDKCKPEPNPSESPNGSAKPEKPCDLCPNPHVVYVAGKRYCRFHAPEGTICTCNRNYVDDDEHAPDCGLNQPKPEIACSGDLAECGATTQDEYVSGSCAKCRRRPKIIAISGSTKFIDHMAVWAWELEKQGAITLACHLLPQWYGAAEHHQAEAEGVAEKLDDLHLRKIDMADEVVVVSIRGYVGTSTQREIDYATKLGKHIRYVGTAPGFIDNKPKPESKSTERVRWFRLPNQLADDLGKWELSSGGLYFHDNCGERIKCEYPFNPNEYVEFFPDPPQPPKDEAEIEPWVRKQLDELLPMIRQGRDAKGQIEAWEAVCYVVHEDDNALPGGVPSIKAVPDYIRRLRADSAALAAERERAEKSDENWDMLVQLFRVLVPGCSITSDTYEYVFAQALANAKKLTP